MRLACARRFPVSWDSGRLSLLFFFFFSSRRRHTRLQGDWSSDVCSSDLRGPAARGRKSVAISPMAAAHRGRPAIQAEAAPDRKSTRLNSSHLVISYAVFCLKKKKTIPNNNNQNTRKVTDVNGVIASNTSQ